MNGRERERTSGAPRGGSGRQGDRAPGRWRAALVAFALLLLPLPDPALAAREGSARLVLEKTAAAGQRVHVVRKGESITSILRGRFAREPVSLEQIGRLNPEIRNLDRIRPGQRILLPDPEAGDPPAPPADDRAAEPAGETPYRVRAGDTISRIVLSELKAAPEEAKALYRAIRRLNPQIADLNRIRAGQSLRLPRPGTAPDGSRRDGPASDGLPGAEGVAPGAAASGERLAIVRPVIRRMRGTVSDTGTHHIPLAGDARITIDCASIPVVELDDGTTVLLDYENRLSAEVRELIRSSWSRYEFLTAADLADGLSVIRGIVGRSRHYRMEPAVGPLLVASQPEVRWLADWWITGTANGQPYRQGIVLLDRGEPPLPADARAFLEAGGIALTELAAGRESPPATAPSPAAPPLTDLRGAGGIAFAERLLAALGETPERRADFTASRKARGGYDLSLTADLLLRRGERRFILQGTPLPEPFVRILESAGAEVVAVADGPHGRASIEALLRRLGIPVAFGFFQFRFPAGVERARFTTQFSALRATVAAGSVFLFDAAPPAGGFPLIRHHGAIGVVQYDHQESTP